MAPMRFSFAIAAAALAGSSAVYAQQQVRPEDSLREATQLVGALNPSEPGSEQVAALKRDFTEFASAYLVAASAGAPGGAAPGTVGTSGRVETPPDWRAKYHRVEADLAALLGPVDRAPSSAAPALNPDTRARLEDLRRRLQIFYAATLGQPDGNPVAHTGAPLAGAAEIPDAARAPVAPTAQAPQTPRSEPPSAAGAGASTGERQAAAHVDMQLEDALAVLDRIQRILDDAIKEPAIKDPGKVVLDRGSISEIRAEIAQIRNALQNRTRN